MTRGDELRKEILMSIKTKRKRLKMKYSDKDFLESDKETKEKIIETVCDLETHNFISKGALVEIVKYQNKKIKELKVEE